MPLMVGYLWIALIHQFSADKEEPLWQHPGTWERFLETKNNVFGRPPSRIDQGQKGVGSPLKRHRQKSWAIAGAVYG